MDEAALTQLLAHLATEPPERPAHVRPDPRCLAVARLRIAGLREDWSTAEKRHLHHCQNCRTLTSRARLTQWHPTPLQLLSSARDLRPPDEDLAYHLKKDVCRRCCRLSQALRADTLLARLGPQALEPMLSAAEVLPLTPPWRGALDTVEGERYRVTVGPRLHVQSLSTGPALIYLLFCGPTFVERLTPLLPDERGAFADLAAPPGSFAEVLLCPGDALEVDARTKALS